MSALDLIKINRKPSLNHATAGAWAAACDLLGLELHANSATAQGLVGGHDINVSLLTAENGVHTNYTVAFDAPHAPEFVLTRLQRVGIDPLVDLTFEGLASISAQLPDTVSNFLTRERRALITDVLCRWEAVTVTKRHATVATSGIESDPREIVSSVQQLAALADAITPCWTEVPLDEGSVLSDLFDPSRTVKQIDERFNRLYRAAEVVWTGEILQVGEVEQRGRRVVVFVGSSNGPSRLGTMWGGRVVAFTLIDPDLYVVKGDVVTFSGGLRNLDAAKRLFRIEDSSSWKLRDRQSMGRSRR